MRWLYGEPGSVECCNGKERTDGKNQYVECEEDDESIESQETTTIRTTTMMYYSRGKSGGKASRGSGGSGGSCPGSLEDCVAACPTKKARVFGVCVDTCGRVCTKK